MKIKFPGCPP